MSVLSELRGLALAISRFASRVGVFVAGCSSLLSSPAQSVALAVDPAGPWGDKARSGGWGIGSFPWFHAHAVARPSRCSAILQGRFVEQV